MKILSFLKRATKSAKPSGFSDFFLHASEEKKKEVFREAARKANEEQREVFQKSQVKVS